MIKFIKKHKLVFIIFGAALIFRLLIFSLLIFNYGSGSFYLNNDGQSLNGNDSQYYVLIARNLVEEKSYSHFVDQPFQPTSYRTPLLPLYFVPFIYLFGFKSIWLAILILDIILSLTAVIVYYLAKLFVSKKSSLIIALLVALEPLLAYHSNFAEADALMVLLFLISLYYLILFWQDGQKKRLYWSAFFLGLVTLAKPIGAYLLILFVVFILLKLFFNKKEFKQVALQTILFILIFAAIISPWLWRNYSVFGVLSLSSVKAYNLYFYYTNHIKLDDEEINFYSQDRDKYQKQLIAISWKRIKSQPVKYFKQHFLGTTRSFFASDFPPFYYRDHQKILPFAYNPVHPLNLSKEILAGNYKNVLKFVFSPENFSYLLRHLLFALFYLIIIYSWLRSFKKDKKIFVIFSFFLILTFYFVSASGLFVDPKYRLPVIPLLLIMFFYVFSQSTKKKRGYKKIVLASGTFPPEISGQSTFVLNFITRLPQSIQSIVVSYGQKNEQRENNIFIIKRNIWRYFNYWRLLRKEAQDAHIIYAQDLISSGWPAALAKRKNNKLIIRIGGDFLWEKMVNSGRCQLPLSKYYSQPKDLLEKIYLKIYKFVLKRCNKIVFNTDWQRKLYQRVFKIAKEKTAVIENPFPETESITEPAINQKIIFAGRLIKLKNIDFLIKAFNQIFNNRPNYQLEIIGQGPEKKNLEKLINQLNLQNKVILRQKISHQQLIKEINQCFLVIIPSLTEISPNLALECIKLKKPFLLTKETGLYKRFKDNLIFINPFNQEDLANKINKLLDKESYRKYQEKLSLISTDYSWSAVVEQHIDIFKRIQPLRRSDLRKG